MSIFTVDVGFSVSTAVAGRTREWARGEDWRRFWVIAEDGLTAELICCQWVYSRPLHTPVWSVVVDWPQELRQVEAVHDLGHDAVGDGELNPDTAGLLARLDTVVDLFELAEREVIVARP